MRSNDLHSRAAGGQQTLRAPSARVHLTVLRGLPPIMDSLDVACEPILKLAVIQSMMRLHDYEKAAIEKKEWVDMMAGKLGFYENEEKDRDEQFSVDPAYKDYRY